MFRTSILRLIAWGTAVLAIVTWSPAALALDPSLDISKYGHTAWRNLGGYGSGTIGAIAQTADGYLWLATPSGLLRFDGVRSVAWRAPAGSELPDERVRALLGGRDGTLWIGTLRGLASWKDGRLFVFPSVKGKTVNDLKEDAEGNIWVGGSDAGGAFLCALRGEGDECQGTGARYGSAIAALAIDTSGALWVCGIDRVWRVKPSPTISYPLPSEVGSLRTMVGTEDGGIAIGTRGAIVKIANGQVQTVPLAVAAKGATVTKTLSDRDGGIWIATSDLGLLHLHQGRVDSFTASDGLSGDQVLGLFEDREANVWVSTSHGLDRFRPMAATIYSRADGIKGRAASIIAARDGSLWASTSAAIYRLDDGQASEVRPSRSATLFEDRRGRMWSASQEGIGYMEGGRYVTVSDLSAGRVDGVAEDSKGDIWFAIRDVGLLRLRPDGSVERMTWGELRIRGRVSTVVVDPKDDGLWLGLWSHAVVNVYEGKVRRSLELGEARGDSSVRQLRFDPGGALWVANRAGLTRIERDRVSRLDSRSGMPCDGAYWSMPDDQSVWVYTPCGLVEIAKQEVDAWAAAGSAGVDRKVKVRVLDGWQGVGQPANVSSVGQVESVQLFTPKAARTANGRIWFATGDGFVALDPARIPVNSVPPPVHVEQIVSDGKVYEPRVRLELPPLPRDIKIDYTGLSFTVPEQVQFRYRLDGRDAGWQDAGTRREAFYTDLSPGHYRFRVLASNNSGVWNDQGDTLEFSIAPAWWQTDVFRAACAGAIVLALYALYRIRIARLSRQFKLSLDARVNERLRIARDLHDTLLQSVQGQLLRLQTALQLWPSGDSRRILEESIDQAADAITEGRDAVQGLRASIAETQDLDGAIRSLGATLAVDPAQPAITFSVEVQGKPRPLHPVVRDDIFHIAAEALRNSFRHAQPTRVEVEMRYDEQELRVRVRDNGKGMGARIAQRGREGHFGLDGMRERARQIGARLTFWTRTGAGTEVELRMPGARAYAVANDHPRSGPLDDSVGRATVGNG